ncbi:MAG: ATP-binding protein [Azospirillaceae bacterium]
MRLVPRTLRGRLTLTLIAGLAGVLAVSVVLSTVILFGDTGGRFSRPLARQVAVVVDAVEAVSPEERERVLRSLERIDLRGTVVDRPPPWLVHSDHHIDERIEEALRDIFAAGRGVLIGRARPGEGPPGIIAAIELSDGPWLMLNYAGEEPFVRGALSLVALIAGIGGGTLLLATWAARRATRPLKDLAGAAERLGENLNAPPMDDGAGPAEIRTAAATFNAMQQRLQRFVRERMHMIAAAGHDLRTPITRLRLRAEFIEDAALQGKIMADLKDMEAVIDGTIALVREELSEEDFVPVDLARLIPSAVAGYRDLGQDVALAGDPDAGPVTVAGRPEALRRTIGNLIDNAVRYGGRARVTWRAEGGQAVVTVEDDGPGIPEADRTRVLDPFVRLETSRSRETGGSGLGLAIVKSIVASHNGRLELANRDEGGLRVTVTLPLAATGAQPRSG